MKSRSWIAVTVLTGLLLGAMPGGASAATVTKSQAAKVTKAFKDLLLALDKQREDADDVLSAGLDEQESIYMNSMSLAEKSFQNSVSPVDLKFQTDRAAAQSILDNAKARFPDVAQVRVLVNTLMRPTLYKCPAPFMSAYSGTMMIKRYCSNYQQQPTGYGAEDWQKGDIATFANWDNSINNDYDKELTSGGVIPLYPAELLEVTGLMGSQPKVIADLTAAYNTKRSSIVTKYNTSKESISKTLLDAQTSLTEEFQSQIDLLDSQQPAVVAAITASKRAEKDYASFDKSFVTAYQFNENLIQLTAIADAPVLSTISTLGFSTIVRVTRLAEQGTAIDKKYTYKSALVFNSAVGKAFVTNSEFRATLRFFQSGYLKLLPKGTVKTL